MHSIDQQQAFYDQYWSAQSNELNVHEILRLSEIIGAFFYVRRENRGKSLSICDLGCGTGWLSNDLKRFGRVTAVDLSADGIALAKARWPGVHFEVQNILDWAPPEQFDVVVSSEVIEHVADKQVFVNTVVRILRAGGWLIITTPNKKVKEHWDRTGQGRQLIEDWLKPKDLRSLFTRAGLTVAHQSTFLVDFAYTGIFRVLSAPRLLRVVDRLQLLPAYNDLREALGLGLYQILVCKRP